MVSKEEHLKRLEEFEKTMLNEEYQLDSEVEMYDEYAGAIHFKNDSYYLFSDHTFNSGEFATRVDNIDVKVEALNMAMMLARSGQI